MRKRLISVASALAMCLALTLVMVPGVSAGDTAGMLIDPTPKTVGVSETFTVDIKVTITGGEEVDTAGAHLNFDTTYLEVLSIIDGATFTNVLESSYNNIAGTIDYTAGAPFGTPATSDFVLASVEFTAKAATPPEGTDLTFVFTPVTRETCAFFEGVNILDPGAVVDGSVIITGEAPVVGMVIDPTPKEVGVSETFTVDIKVTITEGGKVDTAGAHLDFNTTYLEVLSIIDGTTFTNVLESSYNNIAGTIDYTAGAPFGTPATSDFVLASVEFYAKAATPPGGTPLTFVFAPITRETSAFFEGTDILNHEAVIEGSVIITGVAPEIAFWPASLSFSAIEGGANPPDQTLDIWNSGGGTLEWTASDGAAWLGLDPTTGTSAGTHDRNPVTASVDIWGMSAGNYYATITISDPEATNDPETVPVSLEVIAPGALHADFTATPRTGLAPASIDFTDRTTGGTPLYSYLWDFGDGAKSTDENPSHIYVAIGTFTVTLTVTDNVPDTDSETKQGYITVAEIAPVGEPKFSVSNLHISPQQAQPNQPVEISVNIANVGGATGSYNAALYINGQLENSDTVGVAPGSTQAVVFTITRADVGTYEVSFAGLEAQFTVVQPSGGGLGTGGIIAIVVVVIVLIVALVFLIPGIRKRE